MRFNTATDKAALLLVTLTVGGVAAVGFFFFERSNTVLDALFKSKLQEQAALGAMQFDERDIEAIQSGENIDTRIYAGVVERLHHIKHGIADAEYVYIMRKTEDPLVLEFVADGDSALSVSELDQDEDGKLSELEAPSLPGDPYDITGMPALQGPAFERPTTDEEITEDQWGSFLSGYAPIVDDDGNTVAILGIDVSADNYLQELQSIFTAFSIEMLFAVCGILVCSILFVFARRKIQMIRRIDEERTWLTQLAMHQVGNALSIFRFTTELLRDRLGERCKELEICEHLQNLDEGIKQLSVMFEKLQKADQIKEKHVAYSPAPVSLAALIAEQVAAFPHRHISQQIDGNDTVAIDPTVIGGVLRELITNADRFSEAGKPIEIRAEVRKNSLEVSVRDHGVGIAKEDLPHVFERLYVGKHGWERNPHALGLGLFISKGILEHVGGSMEIDSHKGEGTRATFRVPLAAANE